MNFHGADTISMVSTGLANAALARSSNRVVAEFDYKVEGATIAGRFGPWAIVPGGSAKQLKIEMPIQSGRLTGGGRDKDLGGLTVRLSLALNMIAPPTGTGPHQLLFDFKELDTAAQIAQTALKPMLTAAGADPDGPGDEAEEAALPLSLIGYDGRLSRAEARAVKTALAACIAEHTRETALVLAEVGHASDGALAMAHHDWRYVETGDGRAFLAILSAGADSIGDGLDPSLISAGAEAAFALSAPAFMDRILLPYLRKSFRPATGFKRSKADVVSTKPVHLPQMKKGIWWVKPCITGLRFSLQKDMMVVTATTRSDMPLWTTFDCTVTSRLKLAVKDGKVAFLPDPNPSETHSVKLPSVLNILIGWFVNWIVGFFKKPINAMVVNIARSMQVMNTTGAQPVRWSGIRDFAPQHAALTPAGFRLTDTRAPE